MLFEICRKGFLLFHDWTITYLGHPCRNRAGDSPRSSSGKDLGLELNKCEGLQWFPFFFWVTKQKVFPLCWAILTTEISVFPPERNNWSAVKSCKTLQIVDTRQIWVVRYTTWPPPQGNNHRPSLHRTWLGSVLWKNIWDEKKPDVKDLEIITLITELPLSMLLEIIRGETWGEEQESKWPSPKFFLPKNSFSYRIEEFGWEWSGVCMLNFGWNRSSPSV
jgi:hypothetical protein